MSLLSPPQIPLFRITLFYGPEAVEGASDSVHCVFNVKKRSWKGGVQVEVVMKKEQITRLERVLQHPSWLEVVLRGVPIEDREEYREKSHDLLVQLICFHKLHAFIHQGIRQENIQVSGDALISETEEVVQREAEEIKRQIYVELDLVETERGSQSL
ncbi:MAG TPA: hypothetical protein PKK23_12060 [Nitrospirales bacterium]|nr:hypothetical protein [Nitrospiraceae bacterium]HNP29775.1 hypothetical protein [Nitrospirales bacterium]